MMKLLMSSGDPLEWPVQALYPWLWRSCFQACLLLKHQRNLQIKKASVSSDPIPTRREVVLYALFANALISVLRPPRYQRRPTPHASKLTSRMFEQLGCYPGPRTIGLHSTRRGEGWLAWSLQNRAIAYASVALSGREF